MQTFKMEAFFAKQRETEVAEMNNFIDNIYLLTKGFYSRKEIRECWGKGSVKNLVDTLEKKAEADRVAKKTPDLSWADKIPNAQLPSQPRTLPSFLEKPTGLKSFTVHGPPTSTSPNIDNRARCSVLIKCGPRKGTPCGNLRKHNHSTCMQHIRYSSQFVLPVSAPKKKLGSSATAESKATEIPVPAAALAAMSKPLCAFVEKIREMNTPKSFTETKCDLNLGAKVSEFQKSSKFVSSHGLKTYSAFTVRETSPVPTVPKPVFTYNFVEIPTPQPPKKWVPEPATDSLSFDIEDVKETQESVVAESFPPTQEFVNIPALDLPEPMTVPTVVPDVAPISSSLSFDIYTPATQQ